MHVFLYNLLCATSNGTAICIVYLGVNMFMCFCTRGHRQSQFAVRFVFSENAVMFADDGRDLVKDIMETFKPLSRVTKKYEEFVDITSGNFGSLFVSLYQLDPQPGSYISQLKVVSG